MMGCKESFVKTDMTLYTYFKSSSAWRVRIVLNHKMLGVDYKFINLSQKGQKDPEYAKVNPNQVIIEGYRLFRLLFWGMEMLLFNQLLFVSIWRRLTLNVLCCRRTKLKGLMSGLFMS